MRKAIVKWGVIIVVAFIAGAAGASTNSGSEASQGPPGPQGKQGIQGASGEQGTKGSRGSRGKRGTSGRSAVSAPAPGTSTTSGGSTIGDGTWEVGPDVKAGTYRAEGGDTCYYAILNGPPDGDNIENIEENDAGSSNVVVTLSSGQWFETNDCGEWK
jgi:hypothetical protein